MEVKIPINSILNKNDNNNELLTQQDFPTKEIVIEARTDIKIRMKTNPHSCINFENGKKEININNNHIPINTMIMPNKSSRMIKNTLDITLFTRITVLYLKMAGACKN
jgi:hypothetical protein